MIIGNYFGIDLVICQTSTGLRLQVNISRHLIVIRFDLTIGVESTPGNTKSYHYMALSYQWGNESEVILVDSHEMLVPKSLVDALKVIRSKGAVTKGVRIWADSICIDQGNTTDLNRHLPWMREIYRNAKEVVVWLGRECENSRLAVDLLYSLVKCSSDQEVDEVMEKCLKFPDHFPSGSWIALYDFMNRDYWSRLWIIQELCMAKPSSPLLCGQDAFPWRILYTALWTKLGKRLDAVATLIGRDHLQFRGTPFLEQPDLLRRSFLYHINLEQTLQSGSKTGLSQRNKENTKDAWHIQPMLDRGRVAACSRDHDKVYGLMGMLPNAVREYLIPSYDDSVNECFTSLARLWITGRGDLEILSQCTKTRDLGLPSWVPDWRCTQHLRLFTGANSPYRAGADLEAFSLFSEDRKVLTTRGILIDKVDGLGSRSAGGTHGIEGVQQPQFCSNAYGPNENLSEALWRTLVGNITTAGHPAKAEDGNILRVPLSDLDSPLKIEDSTQSVRVRQFQEFIRRSAELQVAGRKLESYLDPTESLSSINISNPFPTSALEQAYRFSRLRRLATTESGYLAMVVDEALSGDVICVLLGSDVPIVLRETSNHSYEIVGACYIHGLMNGEVMEKAGGIFGGVREFRIV
jgi:hypothetical protein